MTCGNAAIGGSFPVARSIAHALNIDRQSLPFAALSLTFRRCGDAAFRAVFRFTIYACVHKRVIPKIHEITASPHPEFLLSSTTRAETPSIARTAAAAERQGHRPEPTPTAASHGIQSAVGR
jgi:hypothetical protein